MLLFQLVLLWCSFRQRKYFPKPESEQKKKKLALSMPWSKSTEETTETSDATESKEVSDQSNDSNTEKE